MSGGRWRRPGDMVQPGGGAGRRRGPELPRRRRPRRRGPSWGRPGTRPRRRRRPQEEEEEERGGGGGGGGRGLVLEGAGPEVVQRLLAENRELKAALRRSSEAVRRRLEELCRLQAARRAERELLRGRAGQARVLVETLRRERDDNARRLRRALAQLSAQPPDGPEEGSPQPPPEGAPSPPSPPRSEDGDPPAAPPSPEEPPRDSLEQLRQRLAAVEAELAEARAAAEARAEEAARAAEAQLQALRRQLEQDKASVKAQVTSLLGELQESQSRLESSRRERGQLEQRAQAAGARCRALEEAALGHSVQLDQLRLQVSNLQAALRVERQGATEEKRKLVQLQVAYHHLFQEYDAHIKASLEGDKGASRQLGELRAQLQEGASRQLGELRAQLQQAEEALAAKQELIDKLKAEAEQQRAALETVPVLQAQADIFKADFEAERAAREQLHAQREALQDAVTQLQRQLRAEAEGAARARMEEMRNRHSELRPPAGGFGGPPRAPPPEEQPDFYCPKCQYKAPDMDTLQIHVMDCIK